jgi:hypothetical protein
LLVQNDCGKQFVSAAARGSTADGANQRYPSTGIGTTLLTPGRGVSTVTDRRHAMNNTNHAQVHCVHSIKEQTMTTLKAFALATLLFGLSLAAMYSVGDPAMTLGTEVATL